MDAKKKQQAQQALEESRDRLRRIEEDQQALIASYDKYRSVKIILGALFVLMLMSGLAPVFFLA
jgi:hypothetical protein